MPPDANFAQISQTAPIETVTPAPELPEEALFEQAMGAVRDSRKVAEAAEVEAEAEIAAAAPAPAVEVAPVTPEPAVETAPVAPEPPKAVAPVILKLMEREAAIVERESKVKQFETELIQVQEQVRAVESAQKNFRSNRVGYLKAMDPSLNLADLAKELWYESLGEAAPPEYRATRAARSVLGEAETIRNDAQASVQALREEIERKEADAAYHQYVGALGSFAKAVPDVYPLVKQFAAKDSDRVQQGLFKIAQQYAHETGGKVLTPDECAAKLNEKLAQFQSVFAPTPVAAAPAKNDPPAATLRNKHQTVQPARTAPDEDDEEAAFERALGAARAVRAKTNQQ